MADNDEIVLEIHGWHTECGACGYGRGGWASSPALDDKPVLTPEYRGECYGCGQTFTHVLNVYDINGAQPIE